MYSSSGFLCNPGTVASSAAYPMGKSISNFSFLGRSRSSLRAGPQFKGVDVNVTNPAVCTAAKNKPEKLKNSRSFLINLMYWMFYLI